MAYTKQQQQLRWMRSLFSFCSHAFVPRNVLVIENKICLFSKTKLRSLTNSIELWSISQINIACLWVFTSAHTQAQSVTHHRVNNRKSHDSHNKRKNGQPPDDYVLAYHIKLNFCSRVFCCEQIFHCHDLFVLLCRKKKFVLCKMSGNQKP